MSSRTRIERVGVMPQNVKVVNEVYKAREQMNRNKEQVLSVLGSTAVGLMAYEVTRIDTGHMMASHDFEVDTGNNLVKVGNTAHYALFQHEGTSRGIVGDAWITRAILHNRDRLKAVASGELKKGFE
jgi:hypothetical protein